MLTFPRYTFQFPVSVKMPGKEPEVTGSSLYRERRGRGDREIFHQWVHSTKLDNSWSWVNVKPELGASVGSPMWMLGPKHLGHHLLLSQAY